MFISKTFHARPLSPALGCARWVGMMWLAGLGLIVNAPQAPAADQMQGQVKPLNTIHFDQDQDVKCLRSAIETGDSTKGPSVLILRAPPGCIVPWHFHSAQEQVIVIRGELRMEMQAHSPTTLGAGGFAVMPGRMAHQFSCIGRTACLLTVAFDRPYDISWVEK